MVGRLKMPCKTEQIEWCIQFYVYVEYEERERERELMSKESHVLARDFISSDWASD